MAICLPSGGESCAVLGLSLDGVTPMAQWLEVGRLVEATILQW